MRGERSDLLEVVVLRWRSHVLGLRVEHRGVGGGPGADWVIGGEGRERSSEARAVRVLTGVVVGGEHRRGGLCGDSPVNIKVTIQLFLPSLSSPRVLSRGLREKYFSSNKK